MDEQRNQDQPWQANYIPNMYPVRLAFPCGKREGIFLALQLVLNLFLWNSLIYGGMNLGFAIGSAGLIGCSWWYLGRKAGAYPTALLVFGIVIALGFARSDDGFVKFVMAGFLLLAVNLGLCLMAGQHRRFPGSISSLLDGPRALFTLGFGSMGAAGRGLADARYHMGAAAKKGSAVLLGLLIAAPILAVMVFLLMSADAAFEGLLDLLPEMDLSEVPGTLVFGIISCWVLFGRGLALAYRPKEAPPLRYCRGVSPLTINTILGAVCAVYTVYLLSQLAYLSGGLSGILPEDYTMAQYARRGFFEMAWLCAINLTTISAAVGLVEKNGKAPLATRLLCLFIGVVTVFLVVTASAKMCMYIASYGLTRLRILTEVIMVFLGISTVVVSVWIFLPKLRYMQVILLTALALGTLTLWADVDTCVAAYNVHAYQSGQLDSIDMGHLGGLGDGAVPYIAELTEDQDPEVAMLAEDLLRRYYGPEDFRSWNYAAAQAAEIVEAAREEAGQ